MSNDLSVQRVHPTDLSAADADRLLVRAASLDAARQGERMEIGALRQAALDAGIDAGAFESALTELQPTQESPTPSKPRPPWFIRLSFVGVHSRRVANAYYLFFNAALVSTLLATVILAFGWPSKLIESRGLLVFLAVWALYCSWGTSKAIRWADRHGWDLLD
jgi:hypothetical protein